MPEIGHNLPRPQSFVPLLEQRLPQDYAHLRGIVEALSGELALLPQKIASKEEHDRLTELLVRVRERRNEVEQTREIEKRPFLDGGRAVDKFFGGVWADLDTLTKTIGGRSTVYLKRLDEERRAEQRAREEEARRMATEEAERAAAAAKLAAKVSDPVTKERLEKVASRASIEASFQSSRADNHAAEATLASPAANVRQRNASGVLSTLRTWWVVTINDLSKVPLEQLRPYLKPDFLERAIRMAVADQVRTAEDAKALEGRLVGVRIHQESTAVTR